MPTQVVSAVGAEFEEFAAELVKSGRYASKREVLEEARAALARAEQYEARIASLKEAIAAGDASGIAEGDVFARVRERVGLPQRVGA